MKKLVFLIFICFEVSFAQIAPNNCVLIDSVKSSGEDVEVSKPVEIDTLNDSITAGEIVFAVATAIGLPVTTGLVLLSLLPPHYTLLKTDSYNHGIGFEMALGYGDSTRFRFSKYRIISTLLRIGFHLL